MKNLITLIIGIMFTSIMYGQRSEGQSYFQYYTAPDKLLHAGAGFALSGLGTTMYATARPDEPLVNAFGTGIMVGWAAGGLKELSDWKLGTGTPDAGDFYATLKGSFLGALTTAFSIRLSRRWNKRQTDRPVATDWNTGEKVTL